MISNSDGSGKKAPDYTLCGEVEMGSSVLHLSSTKHNKVSPDTNTEDVLAYLG